jgi:O-antigen ligase
MDLLRYASLGAAIIVGIVLVLRPTWGLLGLVLLIPFLTNFIPRGQHGLNAETALFILAILVVLLRVRPILPPVRVVAPFVAYYACMLFGLLILAVSFDADERGGRTLFSWTETLKSDLWPTLIFFITYALAPAKHARRQVLGCLTVGLFVFSLSALVDFGAAGGARADIRAAGVLAANPNHLGGLIAAFSILPLMGFFRRGVSIPAKFAYAVIYVISVVALVLSQSRGAWLGFLISHVVWLFYMNRKLLLPAVALVTLVVTVGYSASLLPSVISDRIEATLTPGRTVFRGTALASRFESSFAIRLVLHQMGAEMFMDSPIWGHGYHSFRLLTNEYGMKYGVWRRHGRGVGTESIILTVAVNNGLIGLAILAWLGWVILSSGLALARRGKDERDVGVAFLCIFAAVGTVSLTQNALNVHEISLPFWAAAGAAMGAYYDRSLARAEEDHVSPAGPLGVAAQVESLS